MSKRKVALAALVAGFLGAAESARADVIYFADERPPVEGRILKEDEGTVTIELARGRLKIDRLDISRIEKREWTKPAVEPVSAPAPAPAPSAGSATPAEPATPATPRPAGRETRKDRERREAEERAAREKAEAEARDLTAAREKAAAVAKEVGHKLASPSYAEQQEALKALTDAGPAAAGIMAELAGRSDLTEDVRIALLMRVEGFRSPESIPGLRAILLVADTTPPDIVMQAITPVAALRENGEPLRELILRIVRSHRNEMVRANAVRCLDSIGAAEDLAGLVETFRNLPKRVRAELTTILIAREIKTPRVLELLRGVMLGEDASARRDAISVLVALDDNPTLILNAANSDASPEVRGLALEALGKARDEVSFETLLRALPSTETQVVAGAAAGLAQRRDKRAIQPLIDVMRDAPPGATGSLHGALQTITGVTTVPASSRGWKIWWEEGGGKEKFAPQ